MVTHTQSQHRNIYIYFILLLFFKLDERKRRCLYLFRREERKTTMQNELFNVRKNDSTNYKNEKT